MAGLSRSKNLSEKNLNLKTALQKLYASGIEDDLELFSLSSKITSSIISGPEVLGANDPPSQIYLLQSQKIRVSRLGVFETLNRTKFETRYFTFTNNNRVYFTKFEISGGTNSIAYPIFSKNGSVPDLNITYGGKGFYFLNADKTPYGGASPAQTVTLSGVKLIGKSSGGSTLQATIEFDREVLTGISQDALYRFTPGSTGRYRVKSITITSPGTNYQVPELVQIEENKSYNVLINGSVTGSVILKKQRGTEFASTDAIIKTQLYTYRVVDADASGFFLYDDNLDKYVFIDRNLSSLTSSDIDMRRNDSVRISNLLQFKFAGSPIYIDNYGEPYQIGDSISGELNNLGESVQNLVTSVKTGVQNTKLPTLATSEENSLGYQYNEFVGRNVTIWQRVVMRDQDYLLSPAAGLTGNKLRDDVSNFELAVGNTKIKIPGLFIKVGNDYFRAFSTTDKPFLYEDTAVLNPNLSVGPNGQDFGVLSAELKSGGEWYSYNTQIAQLAQRINSNGVDGAFYYHRNQAPARRTIPIKKGGVTSSIYAVPLFKQS